MNTIYSKIVTFIFIITIPALHTQSNPGDNDQNNNPRDCIEDNFNDCCEHPFEVWLDNDDDGLGDPDNPALACSDYFGWVENNSDPDDNCYSNIIDCLDICDGTAYYDDCEFCDDDTSNDDLSCTGCLDEDAINYEPDALFDSGNCIYPSDNIWHVSVSGSDETGIGTIDNPFESITHTIEAAVSSDTILVQPGIYYENINYSGKNLVICSLHYFTGDTNFIPITIINGNQNGSVVTFENGEDSTTVLAGFTIINGIGSGITDISMIGGGITIKNNSSPQLKYLDIKNNASVKGGGVLILESNPILQNLTIHGNNVLGDISNNFGGGIFCKISSPAISNTKIFNNETTRSGGGIAFRLSNASLSRSILYNNVAHHKAGAIDFSSSMVMVNNVTIFGNHADHGGGAFQSYYSDSHPIIINSIIWGNTPNQILVGSQGQVDLHHSVIDDSWYDGIGNSYDDPMLNDASNCDFSLAASSLCIDNGTNTFENDLISFFMSNEEYIGYQPDMGAIESNYSINHVGDINGDYLTDILDLIALVNIIIYSLELSELEFWIADLNEDSIINILDVFMLIENILCT
ncbi:MAG: hypothetical protein HN729_00255 [Candidatus Marinimicrobia bacterium]|nr:hypothetical protein [Candidatus Neomarinimicrobiota bacterium]MBT3633497.1 hypothetical protein [Candidatus Neomarinimicrobiota bacterium]MBT3681639.1 hypothetical protein [Candidatus Neomarinimicrobiota bacterium]MBT3758393.1 hypothetical protein [Candidatus Neomarinimicrobiota bacterium]MBT3894953.1 hypothetical protein [Candidatus Neomarinimicrobiota bacterium]